MKTFFRLKHPQLVSQCFSSAVSAGLILGLMQLAPTQADDWALAYSGYLIILALVRSLWSEPLIYKPGGVVEKLHAYRTLGFTLFASIAILTLLMSITDNRFFLLLMLPTIVNAIQDYSRYLLMSQNRLQVLAKSDWIWFLSVSFTFLFLSKGGWPYADLAFLAAWSVFGIISGILNFKQVHWESNEQISSRHFIRIILGRAQAISLQGSLLIDKVFPRIISEGQYFALQMFWPAFIAEYRVANLLMGFVNVYITSILIRLVREQGNGQKFPKRKIFFSVIFINLCVAAVSSYFLSLFVLINLTGLTLAFLFDLMVTVKIIELRRSGSEKLLPAIKLRISSSILVFVGFFLVVAVAPDYLFISCAAIVGSMLSLILLLGLK